MIGSGTNFYKNKALYFVNSIIGKTLATGVTLQLSAITRLITLSSLTSKSQGGFRKIALPIAISGLGIVK